MTASQSDKNGEARQVLPHRSGGGLPAPDPTRERVLRDLFERECQDGDKIANALGVSRTEGGFLNVPKILARIKELKAVAVPELQARQEPVAYRWKWDKGLEWHYGDYLISGRDYYQSDPLYAAPVSASGSNEAEKIVATIDGKLRQGWCAELAAHMGYVQSAIAERK